MVAVYGRVERLLTRIVSKLGRKGHLRQVLPLGPVTSRADM